MEPKYFKNITYEEEPFCEGCNERDTTCRDVVIYYDDKPEIAETVITCSYLKKCRRLYGLHITAEEVHHDAYLFERTFETDTGA